ncbi:hypothetical protein EOD41_11075 [Mucilaginibacter limnophilus]|uniref:Uncharacterized protein n=1 Tax=Mucilaginibacter limnophilus TaxID=1932778 RepID=A0A437MSE0_9SPHI|nr:hypothetical protein [Mucilaginibacter limnophilus]RVU00537.1 hypothetical protein EOD41_11075 [Mucilaginibacter limnophilus]
MTDPLSASLFEMRLQDIYRKHPWIKYEISMQDFVNLFPVRYKNGKPLKPEQPASVALDRDLFLEVLVAFKQSFN